MDEEFKKSQATWFQKKNNIMKSKYPNAPKTTSCKKCGERFPNPILNGSNIVATCCDSCKMASTPRAMKMSVKAQREKSLGEFPYRFLGEIA